MSNEYRDIVEAMFGRDFKYTTISMLEAEGLACGSAGTDVITDARALDLIKMFSTYINGVTGQWFEPYKLTFGMHIRENSIFHLPNKIPILKLDNLQYYSNNALYQVNADSYRANKRNVELRYKPSAKLSNYLIDGVFGWLENVRFLETTTSEIITVGTTTEVTIADLSPGNSFSGLEGVFGSFAVDDVVIFEDSEGVELGRRILTGIDSSTPKLQFDKFEAGEIYTNIPSSSVVRTFGRIPRMIQLACVQFVIDNYRQRASTAFSSAALKRRIKSEKTDTYRYDTYAVKGGGGYAIPDPTLTTDLILNRGLQRYATPGWVRNF